MYGVHYISPQQCRQAKKVFGYHLFDSKLISIEIIILYPIKLTILSPTEILKIKIII